MIPLEDMLEQLRSASKADLGVPMHRTNPFPIDDSSIFSSIEEATEYASSPTAYPGQMIAVVYPEVTKFFGIKADGSLDLISHAADRMLFVEDQDGLLQLKDVLTGQQVFRQDTKTIWVFKGGSINNIASWIEVTSVNSAVWQDTETKVVFQSSTYQEYQANNKDENTLYFISDIGKIYRGSVDMTESIRVQPVPDVVNAVPGVLYLDATTLAMKVTQDRSSYITISPGYLTDGANWASADSNKLATIGLIKQGIQDAIDKLPPVSTDAVWDQDTGSITVGSGAPAVLTNVVHSPSWDAASLKLTVPIYGGQDLVVNLPKDKFVTSGRYDTDTQDIILTIDGQEEPVKIPATALVDVYTADNAGKDIQIDISDDNIISAMLSESLKQSISSIVTKLDKVSGVADNVVVFGDDDSIKDSGKRLGSATLQSSPDANTLATEAAVMSIMSWGDIDNEQV